MSEIHNWKISREVPDLAKWHHGQASVDNQADSAAGYAKNRDLEELEALSMEDFQRK